MLSVKSIHITYFKGLTEVTVDDCAKINAFFGKNNSGKSSVLHAIDMAGLALSQRSWNNFALKLRLADLFSDAGPFTVQIRYDDDSVVTVRQHRGSDSPVIEPEPTDEQRVISLLLQPDLGVTLLQRQVRSPIDTMNYLQSRNFNAISGADILCALKFYGDRRERNLTTDDYENLINEVKEFFPELDEMSADRTEQLIATATYQEYGKTLDLLYSGTGLKHFLDVMVKTRLSGASVVLIDEPEVGLHPDLQRRFLDHLQQFAIEKKVQFFLATHSPIFLSDLSAVAVYAVENLSSNRTVKRVPSGAFHTLWGDLGVRPSDFLQADIVLMVEGQDDVLFWEHVVRSLYRDEFSGVAVGVVQFAGDAAAGIVSGTLDVGNITPIRGYVLWIRDRDAPPDAPPSSQATKFSNSLAKAGQECWITGKREIEYYLPESLHVAAQQGNPARETALQAALLAGQSKKWKTMARERHFVPVRGRLLHRLLPLHLMRQNLDPEIRMLVETKLLGWKQQIIGS